MKLYGFGRRGVATYPPDSYIEEFAPVPLFATIEEVQSVIDSGKGGRMHVIVYSFPSDSNAGGK